jgi:hypothetical protein
MVGISGCAVDLRRRNETSFLPLVAVEEADRYMRLREESSQHREKNQQLNMTCVHVIHLLS